ncbi:MAG: PD40 domain-containing protein [Anaerolineae bacterium]|nr:PD40 domain-containing protein [Anaerolineae bacterium]
MIRPLRFAFIILLVVLTACDAFSAPPTATNTPTATATLTATLEPSETPTSTATATEAPTLTPSETPTETLTPSVTPIPSETPTATITPLPEIQFRLDEWGETTLPQSIADGIDSPLILFTNSNDQQSITNIATAEVENTTMILYAVAPGAPNSRVELLELDVNTGNQIYPAPDGRTIAYFQPLGAAPGLYILDTTSTTAFTGRLVPIRSMVQRGFVSTPAWSPDGETMAVALQTGYALDVYLYARDGSSRINVTQSGAYDWWPAWSPDGRYLAFVSDRDTCPSWVPATEGGCDALTTPPPTGGMVYIYDTEAETIERLADITVTEPPRWINRRQLVLAGGNQLDLLNPHRNLWIANVQVDNVQRVALPGDEDTLYLNDTWSPDGSAVLLQKVTGSDIEVVMMTVGGQLIRSRQGDFEFPRFGMLADWSVTGDRIAIGGIRGQCPYGVRVADASFDFVASGSPPPTMCDPLYSPDGQFLAFTGVNPNVDGRVDVYSATPNGFGQVNLSVDLRGSMTLIGWLGPQS